MQARELRGELERRGLVVLGVGQHRANPEVLVVYLHGNLGQWVEGQARRVIEGVPGVLTAVDSVGTPTIVLVRVSVNTPPMPSEGGPEGGRTAT